MANFHDNSFNKLDSFNSFIERLDTINDKSRPLDERHNDLVYWLKSLVAKVNYEGGMITDADIRLSTSYPLINIGQNKSQLDLNKAFESYISILGYSKVVFINRVMSTIPSGFGIENEVVLNTTTNILYKYLNGDYKDIGTYRNDTLYIKNYDDSFIIYKYNETTKELVPLSASNYLIFETEEEADNYLESPSAKAHQLIYIKELEGGRETPPLFLIDNDIDGYYDFLQPSPPPQEFQKITQNNKSGYGLKYRVDNPTRYGNIGNNAVDVSIALDGSDRGALGDNSFASGNSTTASGLASFASGYGTKAVGRNSIATGNQTTASGDWSFAGGSNTVASKEYCFSFGWFTEAAGLGSVALGMLSKTFSNYSFVFGYSVHATSFGKITFGFYNLEKDGQSTTSWVGTDELYQIGNGRGEGTDRSNALTILKNGLATLDSVTYQLIEAETTKKAIVTREYLEYKVSAYPLATNWSNTNHYYPNLPDKRTDLTFDRIIGRNSTTGQISDIGSGALINTLQSATQAQVNQLIAIISGQYAGTTAIVVNSLFPPAVSTLDLTTEVNLYGTGLNIAQDDLVSSVKLFEPISNTYQQINFSVISSNQLKIYVPSSLLENGKEYKVEIISGAFRRVTTQTIFATGQVEEVDFLALGWQQGYKNDTYLPNGGATINGNIITIENLPAKQSGGISNPNQFGISDSHFIDLSEEITSSDNFSLMYTVQASLPSGLLFDETQFFLGIKDKADNIVSLNQALRKYGLTITRNSRTTAGQINVFRPNSGTQSVYEIPSVLSYLFEVVITRVNDLYYLTINNGITNQYRFNGISELCLFFAIGIKYFQGGYTFNINKLIKF